MTPAKLVVSAPLDESTAANLDVFCKKIHRTRAEVIRGLLYSLLVEGKQFIFDEWRKEIRK